MNDTSKVHVQHMWNRCQAPLNHMYCTWKRGTKHLSSVCAGPKNHELDSSNRQLSDRNSTDTKSIMASGTEPAGTTKYRAKFGYKYSAKYQCITRVRYSSAEHLQVYRTRNLGLTRSRSRRRTGALNIKYLTIG